MELHAGLLRGSPVNGNDLDDFPVRPPSPSGEPGAILSPGMEGGRRDTDDLEVRLRWPGDADDGPSPDVSPTPIGPPPREVVNEISIGLEVDDAGPGAGMEMRAGDGAGAAVQDDPGAAQAALAAMREDLLDGLADLRSELAGEVSGPVRDLAAKVASHATQVQRLVESLVDHQQTELDRLRREIDALRREVRHSQKAPPAWFAEAVSAPFREELEALAAQVQMLRRRISLRGREDAGIDAHTAAKIAQAVGDVVIASLHEEQELRQRGAETRRSRRT